MLALLRIAVIAVAMTSCLAANILWFWMRAILRRNGYRLYWWRFRNELWDYPALIRAQCDPRLKRKYLRIYMAWWIVLAVFICAAASSEWALDGLGL